MHFLAFPFPSDSIRIKSFPRKIEANTRPIVLRRGKGFLARTDKSAYLADFNFRSPSITCMTWSGWSKAEIFSPCQKWGAKKRENVMIPPVEIERICDTAFCLWTQDRCRWKACKYRRRRLTLIERLIEIPKTVAEKVKASVSNECTWREGKNCNEKKRETSNLNNPAPTFLAHCSA